MRPEHGRYAGLVNAAREPDDGTSASPGGCQLCGTPVPAAALTWMVEHTRRGTVWTCPACARIHLRAIESKLDQEYW